MYKTKLYANQAVVWGEGEHSICGKNEMFTHCNRLDNKDDHNVFLISQPIIKGNHSCNKGDLLEGSLLKNFNSRHVRSEMK